MLDKVVHKLFKNPKWDNQSSFAYEAEAITVKAIIKMDEISNNSTLSNDMISKFLSSINMDAYLKIKY